VRAGEERFDPSYLVSLSQLVGDRAACDVIPSGQEEKLLFRALDESRAPWSGADQDIGQAEAWEWWRLDVRTGVPERALELGLAPLYTTYSKTSGRVLFIRKVEEGASSQFLELLPGGVLRPGLVAPGFIWAAVKVH
jgi:hypothetical protein